MTYTVATMPVPLELFSVVRQKLIDAGYQHAVDDADGVLDMTHIGLVRDESQPPTGSLVVLVRELRECIGNEYMDERARRRLTAIAEKLGVATSAPAHPQACPMASRCDCLGACKHGFAGAGAQE